MICERIWAVRKPIDTPFRVDITLPEMEDVNIPEPDEVRKEIAQKYPKHSSFTSKLRFSCCNRNHRAQVERRRK
jgi:hypothetical protein